jgi:hypothetical protein
VTRLADGNVTYMVRIASAKGYVDIPVADEKASISLYHALTEAINAHSLPKWADTDVERDYREAGVKIKK